MKLITLQVFEDLTVPISDSEENELASSLIREGCKEPITVWQGVILDGHKRYKICSLEHIDFSVEEIKCETEEEAIIWVCRRRTFEMSPGSQAYRYLMGKWYQNLVLINRHIKKPKAPHEGNYNERRGNRTSIQMSREVGLHHSTLEKDGTYAVAMDVLFRTEPELRKAVMTGEVFLGMGEAIELSRMDEKSMRDGIRKFLRAAGKKARERYAVEERKIMKQAEETPKIPLSIGIKDMPAFNPDMELQGLTLTMPTWIGAMERAIKRSDMSLVTNEAKESLKAALEKLYGQIQKTLEALS